MHAATAEPPAPVKRGPSRWLFAVLLAAAGILTLAWTGLLAWLALRAILILLAWTGTI